MKILVTSYAYPPSIGGIETVSTLLVEAFHAAGHHVIVVTNTPDPDNAYHSEVEVIRQPGISTLWKLAGWADVAWQNNIALRYLWALRLRSVPTAVTLACAVFPNLPKKRFRERLKERFLRRCHVFSISDYVVEGTSLQHERVGNPYDDNKSQVSQSIQKEKDIVYVGRLVSDKGADLLLDALQILKAQSIEPSCTIIGDGPERSSLEKQAELAGLDTQVRFAGFLRGEHLYAELARHRIMAVPSRWKEPFGVVALEGIASGCALVGSDAGGLPFAIGPCGLTFPNGNAEELAERLKTLLAGPGLIENLTGNAAEHLAQFSVKAQTEKYLSAFSALVEHKQR